MSTDPDAALAALETEGINPASRDLDRLSARDLVLLMNDQDATVAAAVRDESDPIARAIEAIAERLQHGGRLIYVGAGTSGRLGVLDAAECPPTFDTSPGMVIGLIAGGEPALTSSVEEVEDRPQTGHDDLAALAVDERDAVVGIAASGRTPYVLGALALAKERGALTVGLVCNRRTPLEDLAEILIAPVVGPEIISGSTRLKAGTAQKMVLNMLSTGSMVLLGKTYGNLMVDLRPTNSKLRHRSTRIVQRVTGLAPDAAAAALAAAWGSVKVAMVSVLANVPPDEAGRRLERSGGVVRRALEGY